MRQAPQAWLAVICLALVAGCGSMAGPSGSLAEPGGSPPDPVASAPRSSPSAASPTPIAGLGSGPRVPLDRILLVCEGWGAEPPPGIVGCRDAASLALAAAGPAVAGRVASLEVGYGDPCPATPCANRRPNVAWVLATATDGAASLVRLARDPDGALVAWPPSPAGARTVPAFAPPDASAPDLGADAPPAIRDREPYPFCGAEDLAMPDAADAAARRCFVDGIRAGSPVELVSRAPSTEGDPTVTLFRWSGRGSIRRDVRADGRWSASICAITPLPTDASFVLAGGCDPVDP